MANAHTADQEFSGVQHRYGFHCQPLELKEPDCVSVDGRLHPGSSHVDTMLRSDGCCLCPNDAAVLVNKQTNKQTSDSVIQMLRQFLLM